jgi:hydrogenase maturation protein HypF
MGRLFDAAAALAGVRSTVNYEAQAAVEFEALAAAAETGSYPLELVERSGELLIDPSLLFSRLVDDLRRGVSLPVISARFHNGVARMVVDVCQRLRRSNGLSQVALSGGVWQNLTLLRKTFIGLEQAGFTVLIHQKVPANDGGLALGQAAVAAVAATAAAPRSNAANPVKL